MASVYALHETGVGVGAWPAQCVYTHLVDYASGGAVVDTEDAKDTNGYTFIVLLGWPRRSRLPTCV